MAVVREDHGDLGREKSPADFKLSVGILNGFLGRCLDCEIIREIRISWAFQVSSSLAIPVILLGKEFFFLVDINGYVEKLRLASCRRITYSLTPAWVITHGPSTSYYLHITYVIFKV